MSVKAIDDFTSIMEKYDPSKNLSRNVMTKYEKTKVMGLRMEQLARGATPTVDITGLTDIREICLKELNEGKLPLMVMRPLPNGKNEYWRISDMIVP